MAVEKEVRISVRDLVEYVYRSGDLDPRFVGMGKAIEGTKLHQKIQSLRKDEAAGSGEIYLKEVSISMKVSCKDLNFIISGRIDGIMWGSAGITLEEIKTTATPLEYIKGDSYPVHWAQAECYAFMYSSEQAGKVDNIRLTYYNADSGEQKMFVKAVRTEELEKHFTEVVEKYYNWAHAVYEWIDLRDDTIRKLEFPYDEYRRNQPPQGEYSYRPLQERERPSQHFFLLSRHWEKEMRKRYFILLRKP